MSHNHSASIVQTPRGDLLACWFHGHGERGDNSMVVMGARKKPGARAWSRPFVMADHKNLPDQNPTMFIDPQGRLWLFRVSSLDNEQRGHFLTYAISTDYEGEGPPKFGLAAPLFAFPRNLESAYVAEVDRLLATGEVSKEKRAEMTKAREMTEEKIWQRFGWMPRQPPIMVDGKMVLGLYTDVWRCSLMAMTDDGGKSWEFSDAIILPDTPITYNLQPALVRKKNGHLVAFMRARPVLRRAESADGGMTWTEDPIDIRCPNSSVAALGLKNGNWMLAVNDGKGRSVLTVYLSGDEGKTWRWKRALENFEPQQGSGHYPTLIQAADGRIHIVYTFSNEVAFKGNTIKHARFDEAWVKAGE
jgi:predicted neuraminidase